MLNKFYFNYDLSYKGMMFLEKFFLKNYKNTISKDYINYKLFIKTNFNMRNKLFLYNKSDLEKSIIKDKNKNYLDKFLNSMMRDGKKIKFLKFTNLLNNIFFYSFIQKNELISQKFETYSMFYNFSKSNDFFFDLNFILNNIINLNESIFNLKVVKLNKQLIKKLKRKFDFEIKYVKKNKRSNNVLKFIYLNSNSYNYYNFHERLLASFLSIFFQQKSSKIYKKKIYTYSTFLKSKKL